MDLLAQVRRHPLAAYWGSAVSYDALYVPHALLWLAALTAYRILMTWVYNHTGSLLLAQLMHACFTGGQALLGPSAVSVAEGVLWYAIFAASLWVVAAVVVRMYGNSWGGDLDRCRPVDIVR